MTDVERQVRDYLAKPYQGGPPGLPAVVAMDGLVKVIDGLRAELTEAALAIRDLQQESAAYERGVASERAAVLGVLREMMRLVERLPSHAETRARAGQIALMDAERNVKARGAAALLPPDALAARVRALEEALAPLVRNVEVLQDMPDDAALDIMQPGPSLAPRYACVGDLRRAAAVLKAQ